MKKFKFLFIQGVEKRVKTKAFVISNIIMAIILIALTLIPTFVSMFDSGNALPEEKIVAGDIYYIDQTAQTNNVFTIFLDYTKEQADLLEATWESEAQLYTKDPSTYYSDIEHKNSILIVFKEENGHITVDYYSYAENSLLDMLAKQSILELNRLIYLQNNTDVDLSDIANTPITQVPNEEAIANEVQSAINSSISSILIIPLFILVTMGIQFIGTDIIEEKSTKAIEVIIASVPPKTHFFAKITSTISFLGLQLLLYIIYGLVGVLLNNIILGSNGGGSWTALLGDSTSLVGMTVLIALVVSLVGTLLYLVISAFFASVAVNQEDFQQVQSPMMIVLMIGYFASIFANTANSGTLIRVLSYIPFTSPMVTAGAYFSGHIYGWEVIISVVILLITVFLAALLLAPIYRASILSYDEGKLFKRIKKIIKSSKTNKKKKKEAKN